MPLKVKQLKANLSRAGFYWRPGKGSHTIWKHTALRGVEVTISGKDGDDAQRYQVKQVQEALKLLEEIVWKK
jgi:predicted RNA binding protein YcfA (HicA-like mRNA interferase family)